MSIQTTIDIGWSTYKGKALSVTIPENVWREIAYAVRHASGLSPATLIKVDEVIELLHYAKV